MHEVNVPGRWTTKVDVGYVQHNVSAKHPGINVHTYAKGRVQVTRVLR